MAKRRPGDRKSGRKLRSLDAYYTIMPFIMKTRQDSSNIFSDSIEVTETDRYLRQKRADGLKNIGMLHLFVAAYVRTVSQRPAINRFVAGQKIYARNNIEFVMTVKKSMASDAGETSIKVIFDPRDTMADVYNKMNDAIEMVKTGAGETSTDNAAKLFMKLPRMALRFAVGFVKLLDYFGILPQALLNASPFHGSMIITDLGSLGIPPIVHHLYDFGNMPIFISFGAKRRGYELQKDGSVEGKKYIDYTVVTDERICDGFYYATSFKYMKSYFRHPEQLDVPPETVVEDVE